MIKTYDSLSKESLRMRPSLKWRHFPEDVLPLWVADMDFRPAQRILDETARFAQAGDFGYPPEAGLDGLLEVVSARLKSRYELPIEPDEMLMMPGIIPGLYLAVRCLSGPGEGVVVQPPVYPPFMTAVADSGREAVYAPMTESGAGWEFDLDALEAAITPSTRLLMLCNPQNPTGRVFRRDELERLAEAVLRHRLWVVSDELHADLTLDGEFVPFASLAPEVAQRTVTLYGPTKAFNIAGLKIGFAFSENRTVMERLRQVARGLVVGGNSLAQAATLAAYRHADDWLQETLSYLRENRGRLTAFADELSGVSLHAPEGTYLAWLDFRGSGIEGPVADFLLERAKVGLSSGAAFGPAGEAGEALGYDRFARLNFATSAAILEEALARIRDALPSPS